MSNNRDIRRYRLFDQVIQLSQATYTSANKESSSYQAQYSPQGLPLMIAHKSPRKDNVLNGDLGTFRQGATWYCSRRDWAKEQQDAVIRRANERPTSTVIMLSSMLVSMPSLKYQGACKGWG